MAADVRLHRMRLVASTADAPENAQDFELARAIEDAVLWRPKDGALEGTPNKFVRSGDPR